MKRELAPKSCVGLCLPQTWLGWTTLVLVRRIQRVFVNILGLQGVGWAELGMDVKCLLVAEFLPDSPDFLY